MVLPCAMQITSLFLHWFPACVAWTERWHPEIHASHASGKSPEAMQEWDTATVAQLILFPCLPYLLWAILYYIKVEHLLGSMTMLQHGCIAAGNRWVAQAGPVPVSWHVTSMLWLRPC